jgi:hypothetical protein
MTVEILDLKQLYAAMPDEDFRRIARRDLTEAARQCYDEELARRDPKGFQEVQQRDRADEELAARRAAADLEDPEPKQGWSLQALIIMAWLATGAALIDIVLHLLNDAPVGGGPLVILGATWIPAWSSYTVHRRAKASWEARRREAGLL